MTTIFNFAYLDTPTTLLSTGQSRHCEYQLATVRHGMILTISSWMRVGGGDIEHGIVHSTRYTL